jgi:hypothetical protein
VVAVSVGYLILKTVVILLLIAINLMSTPNPKRLGWINFLWGSAIGATLVSFFI